MRSVMKHSFAEVPRADIPRSSFNRSHGYKTTFDADYLIPVLVDDVVPGESSSTPAAFSARLVSFMDFSCRCFPGFCACALAHSSGASSHLCYLRRRMQSCIILPVLVCFD